MLGEGRTVKDSNRDSFCISQSFDIDRDWFRHSVRHALSQFGISTIRGSRVPEWIASRGVRDAGSRQLVMRAIWGAMLIRAHSAKTTAFLRVTLALNLPSKGADVVTTAQITQLHNVSVCRSSKHSTHKEQRQDEGWHFCRVRRPGLQQLMAYNRLRMLMGHTQASGSSHDVHIVAVAMCTLASALQGRTYVRKRYAAFHADMDKKTDTLVIYTS